MAMMDTAMSTDPSCTKRAQVYTESQFLEKELTVERLGKSQCTQKRTASTQTAVRWNPIFKKVCANMYRYPCFEIDVSQNASINKLVWDMCAKSSFNIKHITKKDWYSPKKELISQSKLEQQACQQQSMEQTCTAIPSALQHGDLWCPSNYSRNNCRDADSQQYPLDEFGGHKTYPAKSNTRTQQRDHPTKQAERDSIGKSAAGSTNTVGMRNQTPDMESVT